MGFKKLKMIKYKMKKDIPLDEEKDKDSTGFFRK
jgi:hypothetical protein